MPANDKPVPDDADLNESEREAYEKYLGLLNEGAICYGPIDNNDATGRFLMFRGGPGRGGIIGRCNKPKIIDRLVAYAKERAQWKPHHEKDDEEKKGDSGEDQPPAAGKTKSVPSGGTGAIATIPKEGDMKTAILPTKVVDDFPILRKVVSNAAWFADAMNEIGFNAMLMGLQVGHFDPREAAATIMEFRDEEGGKEKFIEFVNRRLQALYEAHENGSRIFELEREIKSEKGKRLVAELQRADAEKNARDMYDLYKIAKNSMCEEDLQLLLENTAFAKMLASVNPEVIKAETISMMSKKGDESN